MPNTLRHATVKSYLAKYSLGVVEAENTLDSYNGYFRNMGFKETIEQLVRKRLDEKVFVRVLDLGCGDAGFLAELKEIFGESIHTIGTDLLAPPKINYPDEFLPGDALELRLPNEIDFVFSFRSLHEIGEPEKIVENVYNSLARGGRAFLSFRTMDLLAGGKGLAELHGNEVRALLKMVRSRSLKGFKVDGFEVTVNGENGKKATAGVNVFLEK